MTAGGRRPRPAHAYAGRPVGLAAKLAVSLAVFAVAALVAEVAGAANLGTALGIGQVAFAVALVALLLLT